MYYMYMYMYANRAYIGPATANVLLITSLYKLCIVVGMVRSGRPNFPREGLPQLAWDMMHYGGTCRLTQP